MTTLTSKRRRKLPASAFAYPSQRKYPIHDRAHARAALSRAAQRKTFGTYQHVAAAVNRRYPGMAAGTTRKRNTATRRTTGRRTSTRRGGQRKR